MADKKKSKKDQKRQTPPSASAEEKKDSGRPGGGAGRVEDVRGSGVYPASGPLPPENAPYQGQQAWGQGKRGEAGYEDSGDSELSSFGGVSDLGGHPQAATPTPPSGQPEQRSSSAGQSPRSEGEPELDPEKELPSGEDAHDRRAAARKASQ